MDEVVTTEAVGGGGDDFDLVVPPPIEVPLPPGADNNPTATAATEEETFPPSSVDNDVDDNGLMLNNSTDSGNNNDNNITDANLDPLEGPDKKRQRIEDTTTAGEQQLPSQQQQQQQQQLQKTDSSPTSPTKEGREGEVAVNAPQNAGNSAASRTPVRQQSTQGGGGTTPSSNPGSTSTMMYPSSTAGYNPMAAAAMMNPQMYSFNPYLFNPNAAGYSSSNNNNNNNTVRNSNNKNKKDSGNGNNKNGNNNASQQQQQQASFMMNPVMNPAAVAAMMYNPYMMQHFQGMLSSFYPPRAGYPPMFNQSYAPTMRKGISLSLSIDTTMLSEYQLLVRQQLEIFEAGPEDVESNTQGRKKQVVVGQVGLRCRHCAPFPLRARGRGAVYYPAKLNGIYQAAQNMAGSHLCQSCQQIPAQIKAELQRLRDRRDNASGGKQYWADGCVALGVFETEQGLRLGSVTSSSTSSSKGGGSGEKKRKKGDKSNSMDA